MMQDAETEEDLDPQDELILQALARGRTQGQAAEEAGVHRNTVVRRLREDWFRRRLTEEKRALIDEAVGSLSDKVKSALEALAELLKSESEITKLGAAKALAGMLLPLRAQQDFETRLAAIEDQLKGATP